MTSIAPLFIPMAPGGPELLLIVGIAVLLFGAQKIPKLARSIGESAGEFKKGQAQVERELEEINPNADVSADGEADLES
ncbi:Sec-independent protein translocase subunit TatA/TatB [Halobiforma nitratireducens]|uniref:Sec-independent protein translocase subunit TatA/TatB n=1 Tax=Halobiforma nitratireducens TaxID=130048 RepID=UPI00373AF5F7